MPLVVVFLVFSLTGGLVGSSPRPEPGLRASAAQETIDADDPDRLYADREHVGSAIGAAAVWEARLAADAQSFESAWKLSRTCYWLGGHVAEDARRRELERGVEAGRRAAALAPGRPEGHFWMAANMGALAESFGLRAGLRYRRPIREALETVLRLDPSFQQGSADRALGRWYQKVPGLFGGSKSKAVDHLRRSLTYDPLSTASHFFLAETLLDMDRRDEARQAFQQVLDAPVNPEWAPEDREFKQKAQAALAHLR
jgi:tetratricopeptide (TPR) repeat protein